MVRAAGMPLNDGSLPPGMLTVRVVRGAFTEDLAGRAVTVDVGGGRHETARTGLDGRAQFAHLPVGTPVRVSTIVDDQQLVSDTFTLPAESGVRVLLVVEDGTDAAAPALNEAAPRASSALPPAQMAAPSLDTATRRGRSTGILAIRIFFTVATLAAFAFVLFRQTAPRRPRAGAD
jgi:hypothetical protein